MYMNICAITSVTVKDFIAELNAIQPVSFIWNARFFPHQATPKAFHGLACLHQLPMVGYVPRYNLRRVATSDISSNYPTPSKWQKKGL